VIISAALALLIAGIAWGAFSFGAVYPWGYRPLCAAAGLVGVAGLSFIPRLPRGSVPTGLAAAFVAIALACALQVLPLPLATVSRLSPEAPGIQAQYLLGDDPGSRAVSIAPLATERALAILIALGVLIIGGACVFARAGAMRVCSALAVFGPLLALTGIVQKALAATKPLGFWTTVDGGNPYGPFVNRNHFAGWMLMAVPVCLGLLCAKVSRQMRGTHLTFRERVLWFGTDTGSRLILLAAGIGLMSLSIFLTGSRSGMMAEAFALLMTALLVWHRYPGSARIALAGLIVAMLIGVTVWAGVDQMLTRFAAAASHDYAGRTGPWADAWRVSRLYPLTGTGINTYGVAMLFYQQFATDVHFSAAHNDYLQVLAEGGLLVGIPAIAAVIAMALTIRRRFLEERSLSTFWIRAGATIGLVSIAIQEIGDFSLQIPGNAFLFAVVCAIAIHRTPERRRG
jgi:O-antigen ligase